MQQISAMGSNPTLPSLWNLPIPDAHPNSDSWGEHPMALVRRPMHRSCAMNTGPFTPPSTPDKSDIRPATAAVEPVSHAASTHRLATAILKYLEGRSLLLGIETREALQQVFTVFIGLALGAIAVFAAWLLLATSLAGSLSVHLGWSWMKATAIVGAAHIPIALTAALVAWNRLTTVRWFADSLNELNKDRTWLKTQTTQN